MASEIMPKNDWVVSSPFKQPEASPIFFTAFSVGLGGGMDPGGLESPFFQPSRKKKRGFCKVEESVSLLSFPS